MKKFTITERLHQFLLGQPSNRLLTNNESTMMTKLAVAMLGAAFLCGCAKEKDTALRMITDPASPPYEFLSGQDEIVGVDIEICRAVAARMGKELKVVTVDFGRVIPAVADGKADLAAASITVTEERKKHVDFSIPYAKTGIVVVYLKSHPFHDIEQLQGVKIGVLSGSTSEAFVREQLRQEPVLSRSQGESCATLKSGRIAFVLADIEFARNCVKNDAELAHSDFVTAEECAVVVPKDQPELLHAVNETIAELQQNGMIDKWMADFIKEANRIGEVK